jgi:O-antigen ligase
MVARATGGSRGKNWKRPDDHRTIGWIAWSRAMIRRGTAKVDHAVRAFPMSEDLRMTMSATSVAYPAGVLPRALFFLVLLASFLLYSPVISGGYSPAGVAEAEGTALRQAGFSALFVMIILTLVATRGASALVEVPVVLVVLLLWCWLSLAWAINPGVAFRRIAFMTVVVLSIVYAVSMLDDQSIASIIGLCLAVILLADWAAIAVLPMAVHPPDDLEFEAAGGAWRGIHAHRNAAGALCALTALYFIHLLLTARFRIVAAVFLVLALSFLILTGSKTSNAVVYVAAAAGLLFHYGYRHVVLRRVLLTLTLLLVLVAAVTFDDFLPGILDFLDDPTAVTGRSSIWQMLIEYAGEHLFLGSGFGSFWAIGNAGPANVLGNEWQSVLTEGHNGYLDLLAQTGLIGLAIAVVGLVIHPIYLLFTQGTLAPAMRWFIGACLTFFWLHNLTETSLLDRANFVWIIALSAYCMMVRRSKSQL